MKKSTARKQAPVAHYPAPLWTAAELRVLDRHVRLIMAGKLASPRHAAASCLSDLERIRGNAPGGHRRTPEATYRALLQRIPLRFRSLYRRPPSWSPAELHIVDRYARALVAGRYETAAEAAAACVAPLAALKRRRAGPWPSAPVRRSRASTYGQIRARARALGYRPAWSHMSPPERKILFEWLERYWRTRDVKPSWYIIDLADLMKTELQHRGFHRDQGFCERALSRRIRLSRRARATGT